MVVIDNKEEEILRDGCTHEDVLKFFGSPAALALKEEVLLAVPSKRPRRGYLGLDDEE